MFETAKRLVANRLPNINIFTDRKIGQGVEHVLYDLPGFKDEQGRLNRVFAIQYGLKYQYWDQKTAEMSYAVQNIFHILFPNNFPEIYAVFGDKFSSSDEVTLPQRLKRQLLKTLGVSPGCGSIRQKLFGLAPGSPKIFLSCFSEMEKFSRTPGYPEFTSFLVEEFDFKNPDNFQKDEQGNTYYVDLLPGTYKSEKTQDEFFRKFLVCKKLFIDYMLSKPQQYSSADISRVINLFKRMES